MRNARRESFTLAIEQMTDNLNGRLLKIKAEVNSNPDIQVAAHSGAGSGGEPAESAR